MIPKDNFNSGFASFIALYLATWNPESRCNMSLDGNAKSVHGQAKMGTFERFGDLLMCSLANGQGVGSSVVNLGKPVLSSWFA